MMKVKALRPQMTDAGPVKEGEVISVTEERAKRLLANANCWAKVAQKEKKKDA